MLAFDDRFTPWTACSPGGSPPTVPAYFVGTFKHESGLLYLWVKASWSNYCLCAYPAGWGIKSPFDLSPNDVYYPPLKFLNDFVLENWWAIVTQAPYRKG